MDQQPIPGAVRWIYLAYVAVLVPTYLYHYDLTAFLWFSNIALVVGLIGLWTRSRLLLSTQVVSISLLELGWLFGFIGGLLSGGKSPIGLTDYMFDSELAVWLRALSLYHLVLPWLLLWLVWHLGYDRRAWPLWTVSGWIVLWLAFVTPGERNVNFVYGYGADPEPVMHPWAWLALLMVCAGLIWALTHWLIVAVWRRFRRPLAP